MNCSEARELFCARVDEELSLHRASKLEAHLASCAECRSAWARYRSTVGLLHSLPEATTQPAFVGQVLDRIRAYEAEGRGALAPMDTARATFQTSWVDELRTWLDRWVLRPVPAMALGSLVVGIALGSWVNHLSPDGAGSAGVGAMIAETTAAPAERTAEPVRLTPIVSSRPFEGVADGIRTQDLKRPSPRVQLYSPNWGGTGLQQQVRYENDGPRIIF